MKQIRHGVFETNSSSTHSLTMCMKSAYEKWKSGELVFDYDKGKLVPMTAAIQKALDDDEGDACYTYKTLDAMQDDETLEWFSSEFTTPNGEDVVAFGLFGYEG